MQQSVTPGRAIFAFGQTGTWTTWCAVAEEREGSMRVTGGGAYSLGNRTAGRLPIAGEPGAVASSTLRVLHAMQLA